VLLQADDVQSDSIGLVPCMAAWMRCGVDTRADARAPSISNLCMYVFLYCMAERGRICKLCL
jgi:hypothetical protein